MKTLTELNCGMQPELKCTNLKFLRIPWFALRFSFSFFISNLNLLSLSMFYASSVSLFADIVNQPVLEY